MKTKCDFCKTEYSLSGMPNGPVKCAICGHQWTIENDGHHRHVFFTFLAAICALLAAIVFSVVAICDYNAHKPKNMPLIANLVETNIITNEAGIPHLVVSGNVKNQSMEIYGAPDVLVYMYDENDKVIGEPERFAPTATLLDAGATVDFSYELRSDVGKIKKVSVKLAEFEK